MSPASRTTCQWRTVTRGQIARVVTTAGRIGQKRVVPSELRSMIIK